MNQLEQLRAMTTVVADTGDIESIHQYLPSDATTNPSLLYKAAQMPQYQPLVQSAIEYGRAQGGSDEQQRLLILDKIAVNFGREILNTVPGRVSTEVDARLSFDTAATVARAEQLIKLYDEMGVDSSRILIKIAATWEGIRAAELLEKKGLHCNLTLMFSLAQAIGAAEAGATLISPFVGRIMDWYKKAEGVDGYAAAEDPGVKSVSAIYQYFKKFEYATVVMGASFRNSSEIMQLAGCDLLTISPALMAELQASEAELPRMLSPEMAREADITRINMTEVRFRWMMNEDAMATEKLAEGIRGFTADTLKLEQLVADIARQQAA